MYILIFLLITSISVFGQMTGSIKGQVQDGETKQPLSGVTVKVSGTQSGSVTDVNGFYLISNLPEGVYRLEFSYIGYGTHIETDARIVREKTTRIRDVELMPASIMNKEVTIRAGLFDDDQNQTVNTFEYNREEILRTPGAGGDIFRAIETLPGVSSAGGEFTSFSVRGGSPKDNIIMVDNIPFDRIAHFEGGNEDQEVQGGRFSIFTPGVIDAASFQAGGFSARYGGRNSSVVDLKIKEGSIDDLTFNGTYDVLGWEFNYDGPSYFAENTSILLSARHQNFRNILRWTGQKDLGDPSFTDILFKSTTKIGKNHKLSIIGIYSPEDFDRNIDHVYESENAFDTDLTRESETKRVVGFNWRALTGSSSYFTLTGYYKQKNISVSLGKVLNDAVNGKLPLKENATVLSDFLVSRGDEAISGIKFEYNHQFNSDLGFSSGFELNQITAKHEIIQSITDTVYTFDKNDFRPDPTKKYLVFTPSMVNNTFDDTALNLIVYTEVKGKLGEALNYNIGGRFERTGFNKAENISPRVSLSYLVSENIKLNLASGIYYQAPDFWLFAMNNNNKLLKNEKSTHVIGGITSYLSDEYKVTVEGYYKDFTDLVVRPERTSSLRINGGKGWAAGIDLSIVRRLVDNWYGQLSYSWSHSKRNDDLGEGWYNSDFNQPNVFNILMGYEFNESWAVSVKWKYATGRPKDSFIVNSDVLNDPNRLRYSKEITGENSDRFDDFHTLNLRVDHRLQLGKFALVMFLDISNLYSRLNVNEERFIYRDGTIEKKGFQILPTFGLKVEF